MSDDPFQRSLLEALIEARKMAHPRTAVANHLGPAPDAPWNLLAVGKASISMVQGLADAWPGARCHRGLLVTTHALMDTARQLHFGLGPIEPLASDHPLPTERSLKAGERAVELAARDEPLVALLSGGASSMLAALAPTMTLSDKRTIVDALLRSGQTIQSINAIRRRMSPIKGGGLLIGRRSPTTTWVVSDVIDGQAFDVGSGPTTIDPTPLDIAVRAAHDLRPPHRARVLAWLRRSIEADYGPSESSIVLSPKDMARGVVAMCRLRGIVASLEHSDGGPIERIVQCRVERARALPPGEAAVWATEPTLELPAVVGRGGRAGRAALLIARELSDDCVVLCAATDGVDGSGTTSGAMLDGRRLRLVASSDIDRALSTYDDATLHELLGTALQLPIDATNLADLHIVARKPSSPELQLA